MNSVTCQVCQKNFRSITVTHLRLHQLSYAQYRALYPEATFISEDLRAIYSKSQTVANADLDRRKKHSERMSGVNNPFYGKAHDEDTRKRMSIAHEAQWSKDYDRMAAIVAKNGFKPGAEHPSYIGGGIKGGKKHKSRMAALSLYGTKCVICGFDIMVHCHHIIARSDGGAYTVENCIILCPNHHAMADAGLFTQEYLFELIRPYLISSN